MKFKTLNVSVHTMIKRSAFLCTILICLLSTGCEKLSPTAPPELISAQFIDADLNRTPLTIVDYSARSGTAAVSTADLSPTNPDPIVPDLVPAQGQIAFEFGQLLDGTSIEKVVPLKSAAGQDIYVGKGDWSNQIPVIDHYEPINSIVAYITENAPPASESVYVVSYRPQGAWLIADDARIDQNPPPAMVVTPVGDNGFAQWGNFVIIHLIAETGLKGISGKAMVPAKNSANQDIVLPDGRKVAATVVINPTAS